MSSWAGFHTLLLCHLYLRYEFVGAYMSRVRGPAFILYRSVYQGSGVFFYNSSVYVCVWYEFVDAYMSVCATSSWARICLEFVGAYMSVCGCIHMLTCPPFLPHPHLTHTLSHSLTHSLSLSLSLSLARARALSLSLRARVNSPLVRDVHMCMMM